MHVSYTINYLELAQITILIIDNDKGTSKNLARVKRRYFSFMTRRDEMSNSNAIALFIQHGQGQKEQV